MRSLLLLALVACATRPGIGAEPPLRAQARAATLAIADGIVAADHLCAQRAKATKDPMLAEACGVDYGEARASLLAAEKALDDSQLVAAGCKASPAIRALARMVHRAGVPSSPQLDDALAMARRLEAISPCTTDGGGP